MTFSQLGKTVFLHRRAPLKQILFHIFAHLLQCYIPISIISQQTSTLYQEAFLLITANYDRFQVVHSPILECVQMSLTTQSSSFNDHFLDTKRCGQSQEMVIPFYIDQMIAMVQISPEFPKKKPDRMTLWHPSLQRNRSC